MSLRFLRRRGTRTRGQAMVEFALILPILALLLVMAIDFGRVFFGWVGLQNAARIAANAAASDPDAWAPPGVTTRQDGYRQTVLHELEALNCQPAGGGAWTAANIPNPTFQNRPTGFSLGDAYEVGDHAVVTISCQFGLITPLAQVIVGQPVATSATAEFMVRGGEIQGIPIGPVGPPPGCLDKVVPNMVGSSVAAARQSWANAGFTGAFSPATGSDTDIVSAQSTTPSSSPNDCLVATAVVTVTHSSAPGGCTSTENTVPNLVGLTVFQARSTWTAEGFSGAFTPASGSDTNVVSAQTTLPASTPGACLVETASVTVTHSAPPPPQCTMPQLLGVKVNSGQTAFSNAGFSGSYTITRPPSGNYNITSQSLVAGQLYACTSSVVVAGN